MPKTLDLQKAFGYAHVISKHKQVDYYIMTAIVHVISKHKQVGYYFLID